MRPTTSAPAVCASNASSSNDASALEAAALAALLHGDEESAFFNRGCGVHAVMLTAVFVAV